jgi:hypothetical protein
MENLLRGDHLVRAEVYASALSAGWMTVNEVRALENLPELEDEPAPDDAAEEEPADDEAPPEDGEPIADDEEVTGGAEDAVA